MGTGKLIASRGTHSIRLKIDMRHPITRKMGAFANNMKTFWQSCRAVNGSLPAGARGRIAEVAPVAQFGKRLLATTFLALIILIGLVKIGKASLA
jgi:hypothetical protein